jgi:hypothetical protein
MDKHISDIVWVESTKITQKRTWGLAGWLIKVAELGDER